MVNSERDERLRKFLNKLKENGVTLNPDKYTLSTSEVHFLVHTISEKGVQLIRARLDGISQVPTPNNITELCSFLGLAQQVSRFTPDLAKTAEPLRGLLSTKNAWVWTPIHQEAFTAIKSLLTKAPILAHYDPAKPTKIRTDGSHLNGISVM